MHLLGGVTHRNDENSWANCALKEAVKRVRREPSESSVKRVEGEELPRCIPGDVKCVTGLFTTLWGYGLESCHV
jgi:hypothetical protein